MFIKKHSNWNGYMLLLIIQIKHFDTIHSPTLGEMAADNLLPCSHLHVMAKRLQFSSILVCIWPTNILNLNI